METQRQPACEHLLKAARRGWGLALALALLAGMACKLMDGAASQSAAQTSSATAAVESVLPTAPAATGQSGDHPTPGEAAADASGLTLAYTKAGGLWRWQGGRAEALPLSGSAYSPRLSPDGNTIAFLRPVDDFHVELWAVGIDGANERRLVSVSDLDAIAGGNRASGVVAINPYSFAWVPGEEQRLAFNTHQVYNGPGLSLLDDLHIVATASGPIETVFQPGSGGEFVFSPDGSRVAISKVDAIFLANSNGSDYRQVMSYDQVLTYSEYRFYAAPKWSPDGDSLRVAMPPVDVLADPEAPTVLWRIPVDGGEPVREGSIQTVPFFDAPVVYSPDLQRVAFIGVEKAEDERRALHLATYDGGGDWVAASALMLRFGSWSPDGRSFVYTAEDSMDVFVGSLDAPILSVGEGCNGAVEVRWIDANRLICTTQSPGAFDLTLVDLNGGVRRLDTVIGDAPAFDLAR